LKRTFRYLAVATVLASALAGAPVRAQYETAVADYERGAYEAAYSEFQRLANRGDDRARRFLQRMRDEGLLAAMSSSSDAGAADAAQGAGGVNNDVALRWRPFRPIPDNLEDVPDWSVVWPSRQSTLSMFYHLPADATVVGLQHVVRWFEADGLDRDLRSISRHGNKLVFAALAAWWWFLFLRALWALGGMLLGYVKALFSSLGIVIHE
jgi:hypothetical protein